MERWGCNKGTGEMLDTCQEGKFFYHTGRDVRSNIRFYVELLGCKTRHVAHDRVVDTSGSKKKTWQLHLEGKK